MNNRDVLKPFSIRWLTRTAILLAITLAFQMMGFPQMITGPAVNAMLLLSGTYVGALSAVIIGMLTPFIAFIRDFGSTAGPHDSLYHDWQCFACNCICCFSKQTGKRPCGFGYRSCCRGHNKVFGVIFGCPLYRQRSASCGSGHADTTTLYCNSRWHSGNSGRKSNKRSHQPISSLP